MGIANELRIACKKAEKDGPSKGKASEGDSKDWVAGMREAQADLELAGHKYSIAYGAEHPVHKLMQPWVMTCRLSLMGT